MTVQIKPSLPQDRFCLFVDIVFSAVILDLILCILYQTCLCVCVLFPEGLFGFDGPNQVLDSLFLDHLVIVIVCLCREESVVRRKERPTETYQ